MTAVICTAVVCVTVMHTSLSRGRLAFYPRMDDVMYMARGAELVRAGQEGWKRNSVFGAVSAVAHEWKREPPHSPWATGAAAAGFAIFGYRDWAAYIPTALPVLAMLLGAARLARRAGGRWGWRAHALVIFAATAPFLAASVYNLKPDYAAGIFTAIAMMNALRGPLLGWGGAAAWRRQVWMGALFGLALLAKPAMMLPTGMLAAGTLAICTARDLAWRWRQHRSADRPLLRAGRAWAFVLGAMAMVAAPHLALAWRSEWDYTRGTLTGEGIEMWGYHGSWGQHVLYYLTGPGGHRMLDGARSLVPLVLAFVVYGCVAVFPFRASLSGRSRRRMAYFAATLAALVMAWLGPTLSTVKIEQFASCFSVLLWLVGVHAAAGVCRAARSPSLPARCLLRRALIPSLLVIVLLGARLATYRWTFPLWPANRDHPARAARDARDELVRGAYETVRAECAARMGGARSIIVAGGQYDLARPLLALWSIRDGVSLRVGEVLRKPEITDKAEAERVGRARLDGYDLLLVCHGVARRDIPNVIQADADEFYLELARTDARFELVGRTVDAKSSAAFEVYRRRASS